MKKQIITMILLICSLCPILSGCSLFSAKEKEFTKEGMTITLTDDFIEQEIITQTAYYVSKKALVTALKEDGSILGEATIKEYAELVCEVNKFDKNKIVFKDGYAEFTYEKEISGKEFYYYARCLQNGTDFWLIQFACETKNTEEFVPKFEKWASSVKFGE